MSLASRRRALLGANGKPHIPNNLKEGAYSRGTTSVTVDSNGNVTFSSWGKGASNAIYIPLITKLNIASGDSIRMQCTKVSGTMSAKILAYAYVGSTAVLINTTWNNSGTCFDKTVTANVTEEAASIRLQNQSEPTISSYKISVKIWINGVQVIPEV